MSQFKNQQVQISANENNVNKNSTHKIRMPRLSMETKKMEREQSYLKKIKQKGVKLLKENLYKRKGKIQTTEKEKTE